MTASILSNIFSENNSDPKLAIEFLRNGQIIEEIIQIIK